MSTIKIVRDDTFFAFRSIPKSLEDESAMHKKLKESFKGPQLRNHHYNFFSVQDVS